MKQAKSADLKKKKMAALLNDKAVSDYIDFLISSHDFVELDVCWDHHGYLLEAAYAFSANPDTFVPQSKRIREVVEEFSAYPDLIQRRLLTNLIYKIHGGILSDKEEQ